MSSTPPKVAILLPTFNGAAFLPQQIDSILSQSFADFELLAVDDGSSDGSLDLVTDLARRDRRVRLLPSKGNLGQKSRLWQLVQAARSPLISIADQDDIWHPERTQRLFDAMSDAWLSYGRSELIDGSGRELGKTLIGQFGPEPAAGDRLTLLFRPRVSGHGMLARREAVTEMAFRRHQPFDWLIALDAAFGGGLHYVDDAVVYHRLHGGNQSNAMAGSRTTRRQRLRPGPLYAELQATRRARSRFLDLTEHLAHSPVIADDARAAFARAAQRCRFDWCWPGTGMPFTNAKLRHDLRGALKPLAGSDADWEVAAQEIDRLTRAQAHPRSLLDAARAVLA